MTRGDRSSESEKCSKREICSGGGEGSQGTARRVVGSGAGSNLGGRCGGSVRGPFVGCEVLVNVIASCFGGTLCQEYLVWAGVGQEGKRKFLKHV